MGTMKVEKPGTFSSPMICGLRGIGEVECEERIDLLEGDDVALVADESGGLDGLTRGDVCDASGDGELIADLLEDVDVVVDRVRPG